jgi:transposase-like protein
MVRKSSEEKRRLIAEWEKSGQSKAEFARAAGIKYATFMSWFARKEEGCGFVEVSGRLAERPPASGITIRYKEIRIRLPSGSGEMEIVQVLKAIKEAAL